jgi:formate hydrogenlyase subunit 3/multisubunit Na+/H+ antiporter MnhD subunit
MIILLPYLLLPIIIAFLVKRFAPTRSYLTFLITVLTTLCYSYLLLEVETNVSAVAREARCGMPLAALFFGCIFIFTPSSLVIQLIINIILFKDGKKES